jgi:hypothetical protein
VKKDRAREIFQMAFEYFGEEEEDLERAQSIYTAFAKMESRHKEYDRARTIYKVRTKQLPLERREINPASLLTTFFSSSTHSIDYPDPNRSAYTLRIPTLRNNLVTVQA